MKIRIGDYYFDANRALLISYRETPVRSPRQRIIRIRKHFQFQAIIVGTSQADLRTKINTANAALHEPGLIVGLMHDDETLSSHALDGSESIDEGGIRLVGDIEWERADGVEYATQRTVSAAYSATFITPDDGNTEILKRSSRYRILGNAGAIFVHTDIISGSPIKEQIHTASIRRAVQSGEKYGRSSYPLADAPLPPVAGSLQGWQQSLEDIEPQEDEDGNLTNWGRVWQYTFEYV